MGNQVKKLISNYGKRLFDLFVLIAALSSIVAIFVPNLNTSRVVILVVSLLSIAVAFVIHRLIMSKVHIEYHRIDFIQSCDSKYSEPVQMIERKQAIVTSGDEHVKVKIVGKFYGPELDALAKKFCLTNPSGNTIQAKRKNTLKVYAAISEKRRPQGPSEFVYVQANEGDLLKEDGTYTIYAYLGGRDVDKAEHGDVFALRVFITEKDRRDSKPYPLPNIGELAEAIYVSDEYFVVVERPPIEAKTVH
jgi:hypothetical protein